MTLRPAFLIEWFCFVLLGRRPKNSVEPRVIATSDGELVPVDDEHTVVLPPGGGQVQPLVAHVHQWSRCYYSAPYWWARCVATESCTARIACSL